MPGVRHQYHGTKAVKNFNFWQKWLLLVGIYLAVFGLVLALFNQTYVMDLIFNNQISPVFWPIKDIPEGVVPFQSWIYGVLGATVSGWGVFIAFLAHYPFKAREKWAWHCIASGIAIWFIFDTVISAYYQVMFNIIFNTILLFFIGLPLLFTRKDFHDQENA